MNYLQERRQKAREAFQKLLKFCPDDIEGLIDLAQLLENTDPTVGCWKLA